MNTKATRVTRFSKTYNRFLQKLKSSFETEKTELLQKQQRDAGFYSQEPERTVCKNCQNPLEGSPVLFSKSYGIDTSVDYILCSHCEHLNGKYQDTERYSERLYSGTEANYGGSTYLRSTISTEDYMNRVNNIYLPKAEFFDSVTQLDKKSTKIFDMGCGAGYLMKSFQMLGYEKIMGSEISPDLLDAARSQIENAELHASSDKDVLNLIEKFDGNVVCMIGVLEHLVHNNDVMKAIVANPSIEYLFISVPKLSISVFIELLSNDFFHRHLSSGHTHLYTEKSLDYLEKMFGLERIGEWYFGADIEDLRRLIFSRLSANPKAIEYLEEEFFVHRDSIQGSIDQTRFTSEIHLVLKINR
jgi:2-polyprenyl-3-methyl-5-hydroxy-6-metoxy-1,4-benzoquinol methylase